MIYTWQRKFNSRLGTLPIVLYRLNADIRQFRSIHHENSRICRGYDALCDSIGRRTRIAGGTIASFLTKVGKQDARWNQHTEFR